MYTFHSTTHTVTNCELCFKVFMKQLVLCEDVLIIMNKAHGCCAITQMSLSFTFFPYKSTCLGIFRFTLPQMRGSYFDGRWIMTSSLLSHCLWDKIHKASSAFPTFKGKEKLESLELIYQSSGKWSINRGNKGFHSI